jgi:hypothetical protein
LTHQIGAHHESFRGNDPNSDLHFTQCQNRPKGLRTALFYTRLYDRSLRTGLAIISPAATNPTVLMAKSIRAAETAINNWYDQTKIA